MMMSAMVVGEQHYRRLQPEVADKEGLDKQQTDDTMPLMVHHMGVPKRCHTSGFFN
jgi:hypothetical protein